MSNQFYVTLPSNASAETFPTNTIAQYATLLPQRMNLDGEWEVGMTEFSYPVSWYNINENQWFKMTAYSARESDGVLVDVGEPRIYIPEGYYSSAKELVDTMRDCWIRYWGKCRTELDDKKITILPDDRKTKVPAGTQLSNEERATMAREDEDEVPGMDQYSLRMIFNDKTHKLKCIFGHADYQLSFSRALADILAMTKRNWNEMLMISETEIDVNRNCNSLFVYTDIVQDSIVGDVKAPLLRSVIAHGRYGENVRDIFTKPMYIPLKSNHFDTVKISIKSQVGDPVKFNYGTSSVTLHFRRVARNNLI
jgi:hypothetical protein